ncbi:MAG: sigma-70 family RNA polymerase sigma factor [Candidatus Hydrogenedentes bacterium]|nr:sigma-70 family RNA polymerase sigma factor [Candidatus Hydrogenedentota bacterium]
MAVNATDDGAVIREVLSGRTDAFRSLVERYFATVRLVALAKTGNVADAEDVAQETFIKAYETLGVLRNRERLAPWLVAIARNRAISLVRRRERERRNAEACPIDPLVHPDHERRETLDAVARQVEALPENLREVVLLHYFEGLKCREIGERLDLNTNAVVKRLARGRDLLGDRLLREWGGGEREQTATGIYRVMGAIVLLPRPDWGAQLASMGGAGTEALNVGGLAAAIFEPTKALKLITSAAAVALVALYTTPNQGDRVRDTTVSGANTAPVEEKSVVATAKAVAGNLIERTFRGAENDPATIEIPPPPPMAEVGFVSGVVVNADGEPIRDVTVSVTGGKSRGIAATNPNGNFRINVSKPVPTIQAGRMSKYVTLSCSMPGYVSRTVDSVRLGTSDVQVILMRPALLSGRVVDAETDAPIPEFSLRLDGPGPMRNPDTGMPINSVWQDFESVSGEFQIEGQYGAGKLDVIASGYLGSSVATGLYQGEASEGVVIALEPGGQVGGVVYDERTRGADRERMGAPSVRYGGSASQNVRCKDEGRWLVHPDGPSGLHRLGVARGCDGLCPGSLAGVRHEHKWAVGCLSWSRRVRARSRDVSGRTTTRQRQSTPGRRLLFCSDRPQHRLCTTRWHLRDDGAGRGPVSSVCILLDGRRSISTILRVQTIEHIRRRRK